MSHADPDPAVASHVLREIGQGFLGESRPAVTVREQIADFLARHATENPPPPILLRGEGGVGKSLLARLIHQAGPRPNGPFVHVNCAAISATLLEAELFGFEPGAFTGARPPGDFHTANDGTLYLDAVDDLPFELQAQLLNVLEDRSVRRLGSTRDEPVDVWILTSTYRDLREAVHYFREDLYRRLGQLDLLIPPLRQRPEDIILLAERFLARLCVERNLRPKVFAPDARSALLAYLWPGNVREVKAVIERVALRFAENDIITAAMLALPNWNEPSR